MEYIRWEKRRPEYVPNQVCVCVCGQRLPCPPPSHHGRALGGGRGAFIAHRVSFQGFCCCDLASIHASDVPLPCCTAPLPVRPGRRPDHAVAGHTRATLLPAEGGEGKGGGGGQFTHFHTNDSFSLPKGPGEPCGYNLNTCSHYVNQLCSHYSTLLSALPCRLCRTAAAAAGSLQGRH